MEHSTWHFSSLLEIGMQSAATSCWQLFSAPFWDTLFIDLLQDCNNNSSRGGGGDKELMMNDGTNEWTEGNPKKDPQKPNREQILNKMRHCLKFFRIQFVIKQGHFFRFSNISQEIWTLFFPIPRGFSSTFSHILYLVFLHIVSNIHFLVFRYPFSSFFPSCKRPLEKMVHRFATNTFWGALFRTTFHRFILFAVLSEGNFRMAILFGFLQFTDFCIKFHLFLSQIHLKILFFFTTSDLIRIDSILFRMCLFHLLCLCVRYTSRALSHSRSLLWPTTISLTANLFFDANALALFDY